MGKFGIPITFEVEAATREEATRIILSVLERRGLNKDSSLADYWVTKGLAAVLRAEIADLAGGTRASVAVRSLRCFRNLPPRVSG